MKCSALTRLALLACILPAACGVSAEKPEENSKPPAPAPRLIGRVASIPPDRRFVLIQSYGTWTTPTDSVLTTRGGESRTANLRVTGEALGQFAAADIQAGQVEIGDAVYLLPSAAASSVSQDIVSPSAEELPAPPPRPSVH